MIKQSNLVFKDIRNMKRNTTVLSHSTNKDVMGSAKDIRNVRSHKQIDVHNFLEVIDLQSRTNMRRSRISMRS